MSNLNEDEGMNPGGGNGDIPEDPTLPQSPGGRDSIEDGFNDMLRNIQKEAYDGINDVDDPEILQALADVEEVQDFGTAITPHVSEAFNKTAQRQLSKETYENLKKSIKIPENCKSFQTPKVNPEIWQHLRTKPRVSDIKLQQTQTGYSVALTTLALMSNEIALNAKAMPKELVTKLLKLGMDGANLIGHQMQDISKRRRLEIKPNMNPEYSAICSDKISAGEFLFGDNLTESLKTAKATSGVIRNLGSQRGRFSPYPSPSRNQSLNFKRPFTPSRGRWNGQQRGRNPTSYFNSNRNPQINYNSNSNRPTTSNFSQSFQQRNQRQ